ncbi:MAG: LapA family protein [Pseudomonadales bacterium]|nr:LapA family protein [Pseudomonadales bacterium]
MNFLKRWALRLLLVVVFLVALLAASDNSEMVSLSFLDWQTPPLPISWWMLLAFVIGTGFGLLLKTWSNTKLRYKARQAGKQAARTEAGE